RGAYRGGVGGGSGNTGGAAAGLGPGDGVFLPLVFARSSLSRLCGRGGGGKGFCALTPGPSPTKPGEGRAAAAACSARASWNSRESIANFTPIALPATSDAADWMGARNFFCKYSWAYRLGTPTVS